MCLKDQIKIRLDYFRCSYRLNAFSDFSHFHETPRKPLNPWYNKDTRAGKGQKSIGNGNGMKTSIYVHYEILVKFKLKMPLPLPNRTIAKERYKTSRGKRRIVCSVVNKLLHKNQAVFSNMINSVKDTPLCFNKLFCQNMLIIHHGSPSGHIITRYTYH